MKNPAKFKNKVKQEIYDRDRTCILCWINNWIMHFHHCWFSNEANYSDNRNNANQGCLVCDTCHRQCHSCKIWEWKRQQCIDYLNNFYNND